MTSAGRFIIRLHPEKHLSRVPVPLRAKVDVEVQDACCARNWIHNPTVAVNAKICDVVVCDPSQDFRVMVKDGERTQQSKSDGNAHIEEEDII